MSSQTIASLALFGGAFDPVHYGHLQVARAAVARMEMERVILIPSAQSPLKAHAPLASDADRLAMLQLATAHEPALAVSSFELEQGGTSYSLKTALHFEQQYPRAELYWIVGADQFAQLARWHAIDQLLQVVSFLVCRRPGYALQPPALPGLRYQILELDESDCSSTVIRTRCQMGQSIAELTTQQVEAFISARALYTL